MAYVFEVGLALSHLESMTHKNSKEELLIKSRTNFLREVSVRDWLVVFFFIFGLQAFFQLVRVFMNNCHSSFLNVFRMVALDTSLISWLVYGNYVYIMKQAEEGAVLRYLMLMILFVGYFSIGVYTYVIYSMVKTLFFTSRRAGASDQLSSSENCAQISKII